LNRIPRGDFENTTGPVSREEVEAVIHHWKRGSVPGMGGIPYDFFSKYEKVGPPGFDLTERIRVVMTILIQMSIYNVSIPKKWTLGIIKLLYKKGDKTDIRNYDDRGFITLRRFPNWKGFNLTVDLKKGRWKKEKGQLVQCVALACN
jgi:hypothetical protein